MIPETPKQLSKMTMRRNARRRWKRRWKLMLRGYVPPCAYCGESVFEPTLDHLTPLCRGGMNHGWNIVLCCANCNKAKGDRTPEEWAADILAARQKHIAELTTR